MFSFGTGVKRATWSFSTNANGAVVFTATTDCIVTPRVSSMVAPGSGNFPKSLYVQVGSVRMYLVFADKTPPAGGTDSDAPTTMGGVFLKAGEQIRATNGENSFAGELYIMEVGSLS